MNEVLNGPFARVLDRNNVYRMCQTVRTVKTQQPYELRKEPTSKQREAT